MNDPPLAFDPDDLPRHRAFIGRLATSLVGDAHRADDLVQQTFLQALQHPPAPSGSLRAWLGRVLRNLARDAKRHEVLEKKVMDRRAREGLERPPATPDEISRQLELQQRVVAVVKDLREPYRTAIYLRYHADLLPHEIATQLDVSPHTVKTRLRRGLEILRARLDGASDGGRAGWVAGLAPWLRARGATPRVSALEGLLAMTAVHTAIKIAVPAGILLTVLVFVFTGEPDGVPPEVADAPGSAPVTAEQGTEGMERGTLPRQPVVDAAGAVPDVPVFAVRGFVVDPGGLPLRELSVVAGEARVLSGPDGSFELMVSPAAEEVRVDHPGWTTVLVGSARVRGDAPVTVVAARRIELSGVVLAEDGLPIEDAVVGLELAPVFSPGIRATADYSLGDHSWIPDHTTAREWRVRTGPAGRFDLPGVPLIAGSRLYARADGYQPEERDVSAMSDRGLEIRLGSLWFPNSVEGTVLDRGGAVVPGALVSVGPVTTRSNREGRFAIDVSQRGTQDRLVALKPGYLPAFQVLDPEREDDVILRLGGEPLSVSGHVVDAAGVAVPGAKVWIADPTLFGVLNGEILQVETLVAEAEPALWSPVVADGRGAFSIPGLSPRTYVVRAIDPGSLALGETVEVAAGSEAVTVTLPTDELREEMRGRVVYMDGDPAEGVAVQLSRPVFASGIPGWMGSATEDREDVLTDADGRFTIPPTARTALNLEVNSSWIFPLRFALDEGTSLGDLHVERRLHVRLELEDPLDRVDAIRVLDSSGEAGGLMFTNSGSRLRSTEMPVREGRSNILAVGERAEYLLLMKGGREVARVRLQLAPGRVNVVRH